MKRLWLATFAMLSLAAIAAITIPGRAPEAEEAAAALQLQVDLSERQLHVIEDGEITRSYPVAVGKPFRSISTASMR